jgi:hypothetical protein
VAELVLGRLDAGVVAVLVVVVGFAAGLLISVALELRRRHERRRRP